MEFTFILVFKLVFFSVFLFRKERPSSGIIICMLEFIYNKLRSGMRKLDVALERDRYGYIEKLPKEAEYFNGSMYEAILETAEKYPHRTALEYFKMEVSYKELIKRINKTACALKAIGVERGDYVTICMPNTPEAVYMFYAVNEIGAIANMVHPLSSEKEVETYLNETKSKVMLCIDVSYSRVENIIKNTSVEQLIVVSPTRSMDFLIRILFRLTKGRKNRIKRSQNFMTWDRFMLQSLKYSGDPHVKVSPDAPAIILYSGGTTGKPKGVILTSMNFNAQALGAKYLVPELLKPKYSMLCFLPNFHAFGMGVCMHIPLYCGMRMVLIPQFNAKKLRSYIRNYRINILVGVPTVFEYMMKIKFGERELRRIKGVVSGGDVVSQTLKHDFNKFLEAHGSKAVIENGYGLTEAAGGMIFSPAVIAKEPGGIGFPLPDSEVLIVDPKTSKPVPLGEDGEILVRGLTIMKGYLNNPKETEAAFVKIGNKKYLKTGDIGYLNERGVVYFKARLKRMIISNGYNIYPGNVEDATMKLKSVESCVCVGIPDKLRGEIVKVFIVLKPGYHERAAKKELTKLYKKYLAKYEIPRELAFLPELPKTKLGKVDFMALKNLSVL